MAGTHVRPRNWGRPKPSDAWMDTHTTAHGASAWIPTHAGWREKQTQHHNMIHMYHTWRSVKGRRTVQHGWSHDNMPTHKHMLMLPISLCSPTKRDLRQWQRYLHASLKTFGQTPTQQNTVCTRNLLKVPGRPGTRGYVLHHMRALHGEERSM